MLIPLNKISSSESPKSIFHLDGSSPEIYFPSGSPGFVMLSEEGGVVAVARNQEPCGL